MTRYRRWLRRWDLPVDPAFWFWLAVFLVSLLGIAASATLLIYSARAL